MRRILVDRARRKRTQKRGGNYERLDADLQRIASPISDDDLASLDDALNRLAEKDARKARLVELRFFAGLTMLQAAKSLGISLATAVKDWTYARAWIHREMKGNV
jgi:RNA polymerase sigma factor (TIGR02999 family)